MTYITNFFEVFPREKQSTIMFNIKKKFEKLMTSIDVENEPFVLRTNFSGMNSDFLQVSIRMIRQMSRRK